MTHQELLDGYAKARISVIYEFSGYASQDLCALFNEVIDYAQANGLKVPTVAQEHIMDRVRNFWYEPDEPEYVEWQKLEKRL
jgi:hypothetical protein